MKPIATKPGMTKPMTTKPGAPKTNSAKPGATKPDRAKLGAAKPAAPSGKPGKRFASPDRIGALDGHAAARVIAAAADVAVILGPDGVVRDLAFRSADLLENLPGAAEWRGHPFADAITVESRPKLEALLDAAQQEHDGQLRHLNHVARPGGGGDVAVQYSAVRARRDGTMIAFGRDLRPMTVLQQRLIDAQQALERDYASLRQAQARYRVLFETSPEPLLVVDAASLRVTEVNAAGRALLPEHRRAAGRAATDAARALEKRSRLPQTSFIEMFEPRSRPALQRFLSAAVQGGGQESRAGEPAIPEAVRARLAEAGREVSLFASLLREDGAALLLVRLSAGAPSTEASALNEQLLAALKQSPDGLVFTDAAGELLSANAAFLDLAQLGALEQAVGRPLEDWVGRPGVDVDVLLANLRQRGAVRLFATQLRGEHGAETAVEVSAVSIVGEGRTACCLSIRDVGRRLPAGGEPRGAPGGLDLPRSPEQLTELIGRVSLKDLVRDATDVIEKLCIEAALELTEDNRASAAEMLGLSRQSLYVKLRRYGLGDLAELEE